MHLNRTTSSPPVVTFISGLSSSSEVEMHRPRDEIIQPSRTSPTSSSLQGTSRQGPRAAPGRIGRQVYRAPTKYAALRRGEANLARFHFAVPSKRRNFTCGRVTKFSEPRRKINIELLGDLKRRRHYDCVDKNSRCRMKSMLQARGWRVDGVVNKISHGYPQRYILPNPKLTVTYIGRNSGRAEER